MRLLDAAKAGDPRLLDALSEAVESGAGLPAVARAAARLLDASVALIDRSSAVLAVAGASPDQEKKLLSGGEGVDRGRAAGRRRRRRRAALPAPRRRPTRRSPRMVTTLLALELERSRSPEWASEEAAGAFVAAVLAREVTDRGDIVARAAELGADLDRGAGVLVAPRGAAGGADGRVARPGADPGAAGAALAGAGLAGDDRRTARRAPRSRVIVPAEDDERLARAAAGLARELDDSLAGLPPDDRPQPPLRRPGRPLPRRQRGAAGGQRRRGRGPRRCSPSRTPAPTACCCRR